MPVLAASAVTTAVIAAAAAVVVGLLTLAGTIVTARTKLAEIELAHRHQLEDAHLTAARDHVDELHVPLSAALGVLADAFLELRERADVDVVDEVMLNGFRRACERFREEVSKITSGGRDVFLTRDLDGRLRDFTAFLRASQDADRIVSRVDALPAQGEVASAVAGGAMRAAAQLAGVVPAAMAIGASVRAEESARRAASFPTLRGALRARGGGPVPQGPPALWVVRRRDDPDHEGRPGGLLLLRPRAARRGALFPAPCPPRGRRHRRVEFFERVALDVDATRAAITEQTDTKLAELDALCGQAEREVARVDRSLAKVKRDYLDGAMPEDGLQQA